ncbi:MAG: T9SS type A sorting domain-containing protein [Bacteroidia bacterium]
MKYLSFSHSILFLLVCVLALPASGQCTIDTTVSTTEDGVYPDPLPVIPACEFADFDATFVFPRDTTTGGVTLPFLEFEITGVSGLPTGMNWQCNLQPNCIYDLRNTNPTPDSVGCIRLFGTPTLPGTYALSVDLNVTLPLLGQRPASYPAQLIVTGCKRQGSCYDYVINTNCAPASLSLTNNIPSNGQTGYSYDWNITGPNNFTFQTNLENPSPQTLVDPGEYIIQYSATIDTTGFVLDSIVIAGVNCSDDLGVGRPDLYWILDDPSGTALINTSANPLSNANTPLTIGPLNLILQSTGTYVFEVWDEDSGLGGADDGCADGNNNGVANVDLDMSTAIAGVNPVTNQGLTVNFHLSRPMSVELCSDTFMVDSIPPMPMVTVMGNTSICAGDSVELMVSSTDSIQWHKDGVAIMGENGPSIFVKETGSYTAEVIYTETLCNSTAAAVSIDVVDLATPDITLTGGTFTVDMPQAGLDYIWVRNGGPAGTGSTLFAGPSGYYAVYSRDPSSGCISDTSIEILYTAVGLEDLAGLAQGVKLFPNPNNGQFTVQFELLQASNVKLRLMDMLGREVLRSETRAGAGTFNKNILLERPQAGMYLLQLDVAGETTTAKVVVR